MTEHTDVPGQIGLPGLMPTFDYDELRDLSPEQRANLAKLLDETITAVREDERRSALGRVTATAQTADVAGAELDAAVLAARAKGATWQQIANAAGMRRQSAWRRWSSPTDHAHELGPDGRCTFCGAGS